jgi:Mrp family chromosome partitioning ATPase
VSAEALDLFFAELEQSAFPHVVIQAPPVLASTDYRHWTHRVDGVIVAARPDQLTPAAAVETRDRLQRAGAYLLGHVAVGAGRVF